MNANLEKLDNNIYKLNIEIDNETAAQEYNKACRKFGETLTIPGFRKGKAPRAIIEKHVGLEKIKESALDKLLPGILADVISEHQLDMVTEPVIESYDFEIGKPVSVTARIETKPEFDLPGYKGIKVEVPEFRFEENAVEKQIEALLNKLVKFEEVIDRPSEANDVVFIDFDGSIEGRPITGGSGKNHQLDLANSHFIPGFAEQLVDKKLGEEFTINVTFPQEYQEKAIAGKNAEFKIKINEIKKKVLPEPDDEFARRIGPFNTIEELREDLQKYLENSRENENTIRAEKAIIEKILGDAQLETPDTMINREAKYLMEEMQRNLKEQGIPWEKVVEEQGYEKTWNSLREEAAKRVKTSLVLGAIAKAENIRLTDEDFQQKVKELSSSYNTDEKVVYEQMAKNPSLAQGLSQQIMSQKIVNYLLENNEVKYIEDNSD